MITKQDIESAIEPLINEKEIFIVETIINIKNNSIIIYLDGFEGVTIDDCVEVSRRIEHEFEEEIGMYELKVSSAGIDLPLRILPQYKKNIGRNVEVIEKEGKKQKGELIDVNENNFVIRYKTKEKTEGSKKKKWVEKTKSYSFDQIKSTKVIPDFS